LKQDTLQINWFDGNWLEEQINGKKIKYATKRMMQVYC
jgi:hypothetical protein